MSEGVELVARAALIGIGATLVMDGWAAFQKHVLGMPTLDYAMLGRWFGHFLRGRFMHRSIAEASPVRGELMIGWSAHYVIGITYAILLLAIWGLDWARQPSLVPAVVVGVLTVAGPFFIMQPGMGAGIAASNTPNPNGARLRSLAAHTVYGLGLYGSALVWAWLLRP